MKLNTYSVRDCCATLAIVALLLLTATGNAIAMLLFSPLAIAMLLFSPLTLAIWFVIDGFGR